MKYFRSVTDFHFVDLRWGIRENSTITHDTGNICMAEIKRCFQTSPVSLPVFIYLGFDRYGWIPVPTELNVDTFEKVQNDISDEEKKILKTAFVKDSNAVPCLYRLKQVENGPEWRETEEKLRAIFEKFGELSEKLTSMTEQEVNYALGFLNRKNIFILKIS